MLGWDIEGHETPGQLVEMDLSETKIVEGGSSYYGSRYTRRDTLDYGMFLRCSQLQRIRLAAQFESNRERCIQRMFQFDLHDNTR